MIKIPISGLSQNSKPPLLNLVPLKVSSACGLEEFFFAALASGLLIRDPDLEPEFFTATF